jgi:hypothetical protein
LHSAHDDNMEALARADDISDRRSGVEEAEGRDNIQDSEDKVEDGRDIQSDKEESQNDSYNVVQEVSNAQRRRGLTLMHYANASGKHHIRPYNTL